MKIRVMSDLHNELNSYKVEELDTDSETILVLAGDINTKYKAARRIKVNDDEYPSWLETLSNQFHAVIYVLGNHEHWGYSLDLTAKRIQRECNEQGLDNVFVLDNSVWQEGDVRILGCTLWTDFNKQDPFTMWEVPRVMNDFRRIRIHNHKRKISAHEILGEHKRSVSWLQEELSKPWYGKTVVVTHHAPSLQSIHPKYKMHVNTNGAYASDLEYIMEECEDVVLWVHGHMHDNFDYNVNQCRVICNPRGYHGFEPNEGFKPHLLFETDEL